MERGLFRFILRYSGKDQAILVLLAAAALPFLYFTFELPKTIVNQAIEGNGGFPKVVLGHSFEQIPYLMLLCGLFLALVFINGGFKYFASTYRYRVGDRLLRRLRYELIERVLRFPATEFRNTSGGQVVSMITAETSSLGFFIAEAFAVPAVAIGTLSTIVLFMFLQDWMMGVAAIALYPMQIYLIPKIQKRVNALQRDEVRAVRGISDRIGAMVAGVNEIHGHDTSQYELADFSQRLGVVFNLRVQLASKRYIANVLNQFFSQLTPFFFLSIGGYLVITGELTLGSLVAVLAAYKDMYSPWKDLIDYYQKAEDARVKYDQLTDYFAPPGLMDRAMLIADGEHGRLGGERLVATNVVVEADEGVKSVDGASVALQLPVHAAIIGDGGSGREEFARLLARQVFPNSGRLQIGGRDLASLPDSFAGRRIGYVGPEAYLGSGTIRDALVYPLLHRPADEAAHDGERQSRRRQELKEAALVGNSTHDVFADWVDYESAGCANRAELSARIIAVLRMVDLEREVYDIGLRRAIDPIRQPELAAKLIAARKLFQDRLKARQLTSLVECFDPAAYNVNASVAENILFGTPVGAFFAIENLGENPYMLRIIADAHLTSEFLDRGRRLAATMADIFRDLPPGHDFFERFSFIRAEDLPAFDAILRRIEAQGVKSLDEAERRKLMALPFKLVVTQHHVGLIDAALQARLLSARRAFAANLPPDLRGAVQFFDREGYNAASSIFENVLFGKVAATKAGSVAQVSRLVSEVLDEMGLRAAVVEAGLEYEIGIGGSRLSAAQRQKLALARCLLKRPDMLILSDALSALDPGAQDSVFSAIKAEMQGRTLILVESNETRARELDHMLVMEQGKIAEGTKAARGQASAGADAAPAGGHDNLNSMVAMLAQIPLFAAIDRSRLKLLAFTSEHISYDAGQTVFHQGEPGDKAYVVIEGAVEVVLETPAGAHVVASLGRNQVFGEMALLSNMPRTTTIRAASPLTLLAISQDVFLRLVEEHSEIATGVMRILTERLATTLREYSKLSVQARKESDAAQGK